MALWAPVGQAYWWPPAPGPLLRRGSAALTPQLLAPAQGAALRWGSEGTQSPAIHPCISLPLW